MLQEDCTAAFAEVPAALSPTIFPLLQLTLAQPAKTASSLAASSTVSTQPVIAIGASTDTRDSEQHGDDSQEILVAFAAAAQAAQAAAGSVLICIVRVTMPPGDDSGTATAVRFYFSYGHTAHIQLRPSTGCI